jgi:hypothetical protein
MLCTSYHHHRGCNCRSHCPSHPSLCCRVTTVLYRYQTMESFILFTTTLCLALVATALLATTKHADIVEVSKWNLGSRDESGSRLQVSSLGRALKKTPKTKKPKQSSKSKSPTKQSCYTSAQSADFVTALTNAFSSGATSADVVTLAICAGNTIEIANPITIPLDTAQNTRRLYGKIRNRELNIDSSISGLDASIKYIGTQDQKNLISFSPTGVFPVTVDAKFSINLLALTYLLLLKVLVLSSTYLRSAVISRSLLVVPLQSGTTSAPHSYLMQPLLLINIVCKIRIQKGIMTFVIHNHCGFPIELR